MNFLMNPFLIMSLLATSSSISTARTIADAHVEYAWSLPLALLLTIVGMSFQSVEERSDRTKEEMERDANATIKRLLSEFGSQLKADGAKVVAAIYIRYSTGFQDSFEAQLRSALHKAISMELSVSEENIFFDLGASGAKKDRKGLEAIRDARLNGKFKVFISMATSRLARKLTTLLEVLDEEFVGNGIRCILTDQNLDSDQRQNWKLLLPVLGWLDEIQRTSHAGHIVASHKMLLARGLKYSTLTFGFGGLPIDGYFTKRGRPVELIIVNEATAKVVRIVFEKFLGGTPIARIVKQLNEDPSLPRPHKSKKKRFSRDFVMNVLKNEQYVGITVYNDEVDVSTATPDEMRELATSNGSIFSFPDRQIISDEDFIAARQKLNSNADKPHLKEPKSKRPLSEKRPRLLNQFLFCPGCNNMLVATGAHGNNYGCKTCKFHPIEQQHLYSQMPRMLATDLVIDAICDKVFSNQEVLEQSVLAFSRTVSELQRPDPNALKVLEAERSRVKGQFDLLLSTFSGDNLELAKDQLIKIRSDLSRLDSDIKKQQLLDRKAVGIPNKDEAVKLLKNFETVLKHFAFTCDGEELDKARELIRIITGGRIDAYQRGEKAAKKGWCQLRFSVCPAALLLESASLPCDRDNLNKIDIVIDIIEPEAEDPRIAQARSLYDQGKFETEIAKDFGVSRGTMFKWIKQSFEAEGREKPNGYTRRKQLETGRELHHYQKISDRVFELSEAGMHLQDIAELLGTNRDVITKSLTYAREKRGLPPLDGRTRRKSLPRKPR